MRTLRNYGLAALAFAVVTLMPVAPVRAADTVVVGTVGSPSANLWPLFIGIDKGFFTAENIKVDLIYIPASANASRYTRIFAVWGIGTRAVKDERPNP